MTLTAKPGTACNLTRIRGLFFIFACGVFLSTTTAAEDLLFAQHEIVIGSPNHQTVLTGFLFDGAIAELAVVHIDENGSRGLRIYTFGDGAWVQSLDATLGAGVLFVDVANIDGHDRLITYEHGRMKWFDPKSASERTLVAVTSNFNMPPAGIIPHVDVTRDVNNDHRDDLVVPDVDGWWVFIQMEDGTFAESTKIGPSVNMDRIFEADGYRFNPWDDGRVHKMDYNQDGRSDLVFWDADHFEVFIQDGRGLFDPVANKTFTTEVAFDSDDLTSLAAPKEVRRRRIDYPLTTKTTGSVLHSLTDMNNDGIADLGVFSLDIRSMWSVHTAYEVHFGTQTPDGIVFAPDIGAATQSRGLPFQFGSHDFDQDGQMDMMFTTIKIGFFRTIGLISSGVLTRTVPLHLDFYHMESGTYASKPDATRKIKAPAPGVSGEKGILFPSLLIGDVNGDSHLDLLVQKGQDELRVFLGVPEPDLFARRPHKVTVPMPSEEYTWLVDLNKDGKQDILMHHPPSREPHRVTMLIAR